MSKKNAEADRGGKRERFLIENYKADQPTCVREGKLFYLGKQVTKGSNTTIFIESKLYVLFGFR